MKIYQFDQETDAELNADERIIATAQEKIAEWQAEFDGAWANVFALFDKHGEPGKAKRFIAASEYTLSRQVTNPSEVLDVGQLEAHGRATQGSDWAKIWTSITDPGPRVLNQAKLGKAIKTKKIPAALVELAMTKPRGVTSRVRRKATKDDIAYLQMAARANAEEGADQAIEGDPEAVA